MKALICNKIANAQNLEFGEIPMPIIDNGEVLIKIHAVGINYRDSLIIEDKYQLKASRPFSPGGEIAGEIIEIADDVTEYSIGDRVCGEITFGGLAQFAKAKTSDLIKIKNDINFDIAAASLITYGTSLYALKQRARLKTKENVLVLGASGGVGIAAIQLSKAMGAKVFAGVSSEEKAKIALENGADEILIYSKNIETETEIQELRKFFKNNMPQNGFDVIYDAIGGNYSEAALRSLNWNGRFLVIGFPSGIPKIPLNLTLVKGCEISGVFYTEFMKREPIEHSQNFKIIQDFIKKGLIKPLISAKYSLENSKEAILALKNREAIGKILVTFP